MKLGTERLFLGVLVKKRRLLANYSIISLVDKG